MLQCIGIASDPKLCFPRPKPPGNLEPIPRRDTAAEFRLSLHTAKRMIETINLAKLRIQPTGRALRTARGVGFTADYADFVGAHCPLAADGYSWCIRAKRPEVSIVMTDRFLIHEIAAIASIDAPQGFCQSLQ